MFDPKLIRDLPGWKTAPVPVCFGGDIRALTWCCHPGYPLTFSNHCRRKQTLNKIGMTEEEYVQLKDEFSKEFALDDDRVCFKSLSYCCMRRGGCPGERDNVLREKFKDCLTWDEILEKYFKIKKKLAIRILEKAKNKELVKTYLEELKNSD
ncbi:MAG: methanogenesis marker 9 domain-containing protein [Candidatus Helarchaeota archaeon]